MIMFIVQLGTAFQDVFKESFIAILSIDFRNGSVLVDSVVQLRSTPSADQLNRTVSTLFKVFKENEYVIDDLSFNKIEGIDIGTVGVLALTCRLFHVCNNLQCSNAVG